VDDTADLSGPPPAAVPAWERLEDQLAWHDRKAAKNQQSYRIVKVIQLVAAAAIPVVAAAGAPGWLTGGLGALVVVVEGINQLYRFHDGWLNYRTTCEALTREKFLYMSSARPYGGSARPDALLAERVEGILTRQHTDWTAAQVPREGRAEKE
jgi:hypothetical protein